MSVTRDVEPQTRSGAGQWNGIFMKLPGARRISISLIYLQNNKLIISMFWISLNLPRRNNNTFNFMESTREYINTLNFIELTKKNRTGMSMRLHPANSIAPPLVKQFSNTHEAIDCDGHTRQTRLVQILHIHGLSSYNLCLYVDTKFTSNLGMALFSLFSLATELLLGGDCQISSSPGLSRYPRSFVGTLVVILLLC